GLDLFRENVPSESSAEGSAGLQHHCFDYEGKGTAFSQDVENLGSHQSNKGKDCPFLPMDRVLGSLKGDALEGEDSVCLVHRGRKTRSSVLLLLSVFSSDVDCKVFLASDSGGVGLDGLQYASSTVIHCELPWNPAKLDQRTGRVLRIGQTQPVTVYHMVARGATIENNMLEVLASKRDIREEILKT
ncbi:MAG: DEAD/DEAH box helicase, partial [Leptolyngbyaceae cyanobacterium SM1_4_3]|nr:DEAD/DEAH box helicase [Leptolyngbyaceae cyanobacterium SM1_4_3]